MTDKELTASGMMSLARIQMAPLSRAVAQAILARSEKEEGNSGDQNYNLETSSLDIKSKNKKYLDDFERAWVRFIQQRSESANLPKGRRERNIEHLQEEIRNQESTERDILRQLTYIEQTSESMQYRLEQKIRQARESDVVIKKIWTERLQDMHDIEGLQEDTFPWFNFMRKLDLQVSLLPSSQNESPAEITESASSKSNKKSQAVRPSDRAICLVAADPRSSSNDALRAYRVDNAILTTHVEMLRKEIERYEKTIESQELASQLLEDLNVRGMLSHLPPQGTISGHEETRQETGLAQQRSQEEPVPTDQTPMNWIFAQNPVTHSNRVIATQSYQNVEL